MGAAFRGLRAEDRPREHLVQHRFESADDIPAIPVPRTFTVGPKGGEPLVYCGPTDVRRCMLSALALATFQRDTGSDRPPQASQRGEYAICNYHISIFQGTTESTGSPQPMEEQDIPSVNTLSPTPFGIACASRHVCRCCRVPHAAVLQYLLAEGTGLSMTYGKTIHAEDGGDLVTAAAEKRFIGYVDLGAIDLLLLHRQAHLFFDSCISATWVTLSSTLAEWAA